MERHLKWPLDLLPVNKRREETGKHPFKNNDTLASYDVFIFIQAKSADQRALKFVHVIKQTWKDCCMLLILDWRILMRKSSKILGKTDECINVANSLS